MTNPGQVTLWLGLISIGISSVGYFLFHVNKDNGMARTAARLGFVGFTTSVTLSSILLMHFILNHDFVYSYVVRYSSRELPLIYLVSSFWAGQEGSFLLWVLLGAWLGIWLMFKARDVESRVMLIFNLNNLFLMILLIKQSPFQTVPFPPADGNGLNMLLQDPWMAIHPPIVFLGYAAYAIPFAFAVSALWQRDYDGWIKPALPWTIFAFVSLGAGIIIGGYWSYKVLGWGGYWGWDPVENASLLPWLAGTALVHGMILQHTRKKLRKTNFFLAAFSFILVIYCTFLTRSGVLADFSVHSFVDLGITGWLVLFMAVFIAISLWLFVTRVKDIPVSEKGSSSVFFSREFGLIGAMVLLCLSCIVTGLGTSAPLITRLTENASKVSTQFYVDTNLPLALVMLVLLSVVPLMRWGQNNFSQLVSKMPWALAGAAASLAVTLWQGFPGLSMLLLSVLAGATAGMNLVLAAQLLRKKISLSSGAVVHFGVGLMFLGVVASSAYDRSEKIQLSQGESKSAMGYELTLDEPTVSKESSGIRLHFPLDVKSDSTQFSATPDIYSERTRGGQPKRFIHPHIQRGLVSDLYISPVDFDPGKPLGTANSVILKKNQEVNLGDYTITFETFEVSGMMTKKDIHDMHVAAKLVAVYRDEAPVILEPVVTIGQLSTQNSRVKLPGPKNDHITLVNIDATNKTVHIKHEIEGLHQQDNTANLPSLIAEVSIKPGMTVLWLGTFLILLGGCIGIVRRSAK